MKRKEHDIFELVESGQFEFEEWLKLNDLALNDKARKKLAKAVALAEKNVSITPVIHLNSLAAGVPFLLVRFLWASKENEH